MWLFHERVKSAGLVHKNWTMLSVSLYRSRRAWQAKRLILMFSVQMPQIKPGPNEQADSRINLDGVDDAITPVQMSGLCYSCAVQAAMNKTHKTISYYTT